MKSKYPISKYCVVFVLVALTIVSAVFLSRLFRGDERPLTIVATPAMSYGNWGYGAETRFDCDFDRNLLDDRPRWEIGQPNPPLSANDAVVAAQKVLAQLVDRKQFPDGSEISRLELVPGNENQGWYWIVEFMDYGSSNDTQQRIIKLVVLMDGMVVEPKVFERVDLGWPLPSAPDPEKPVGISDSEIIREFVAKLNPERKYAGQIVSLSGELKGIPEDDQARNSGFRVYLMLDDGTKLIMRTPLYMLQDPNIGPVAVELIGLRDLRDEGTSWEGLKLFPAVRIR